MPLRTAFAANAARRTVAIAGSLVVIGVGGFLVLVGLVKLSDPDTFIRTVASHELVQEPLTAPAAWTVAVSEVAVGAIAIAWVIRGPAFLPRAALALAAVFAAFTAYAYALTIQPPPEPVSCGCALTSSTPIDDWSTLVSRNGLWTAALGAIALLSRHPPEPSPHPKQTADALSA